MDRHHNLVSFGEIICPMVLSVVLSNEWGDCDERESEHSDHKNSKIHLC